MATKPLRRKLGVKEKNYIAYCEKFYFLNNSGFPSNEQAALALNYSTTEVAYFLKNLKVQEALDIRGLPYHSAGAQGELTPLQVAAAITVVNFADERPVDRKLDELGVTPSQYYAWLDNPQFRDFVNHRADSTLRNVRHEALTEFAKLVRKGDLGAIKYYFELTGQDRNHEVQNLQSLLGFLIEIIQKHVRDPATLAALSKDILNAVPGIARDVEVNTQNFNSEPVAISAASNNERSTAASLPRLKDSGAVARRGNVLTGEEE